MQQTTNCPFLSLICLLISRIFFQLNQFKSGAIQLSNQDGTKENGDGEKVKVISSTFSFVFE